MNKIINIVLIVSLTVIASISILSFSSPTATEKVDSLPQIIKAISIDENLKFAGEIIPNHPDARERLDRELMVNAYWHSSTIQLLKLSNRYFPVIEKIFIEEGVPLDFKYLAAAESGFRQVSSSANARGLWQFRKLAAKELKLEVNDEVDERYHVEKSTRAAAQYLKKLKRRFGTWTDAAAAYNVGPTNYANAMKDQNEDNFFDLNLNKETSRYLYRIMAIREILSNPQKFGFYVEPSELYQPLDDCYSVLVDKSIKSWSEFAHNHGISYRELKRYNPWLRESKLTVIKNTYQIKVPKKK